MSQEQDKARGQAIDLKGLVLASLAAVVAAVVTSTFFPKGALISTALTPVIVTLIREGLRKPTEKLTATAARVTPLPVRGSAALAGVGGRRGPAPERFDERRLREAERADGGRATNGPGVAEGLPPAPVDDTRSYTRGTGAADSSVSADTAPAAAAGQTFERKIYGRKRFRLKLALLTGLGAFVIAVGALTIPELLFGGSVTGDRSTSLFGRGSDSGQVEERDSGAGSSGQEGSEPTEEDGGAEGQSAPAPQETAPEEPAPEEPAPEAEPAPQEPVVPAPSGSGSAEPPAG